MNFNVVATAMAALVVSVLFVVPAEAQGYGQGNYGHRTQQEMQARKMAHKQMRRDMARQQQGYGNGCMPLQAPYYGSTSAYPGSQYFNNGYGNSSGAYDPYVNGMDPNLYYPSSSPLRGALSGLGALTGTPGLTGVSGLSQLGNLGGLGQLGNLGGLGQLPGLAGLGQYGNSTGYDQYGNAIGYDQYGNQAAVDQYGNPIGYGQYNTSSGLNGNTGGTAAGVIQGLLGLF